MLPSVQTFACERTGTRRAFTGAFHPRIWIHIVDATGTADETLVEGLSAGRPSVGRRLVGCTLSGSGRLRHAGRTEFIDRASVGFTCNGRGDYRARSEACADASSLSFNIDWDRSYFGSRVTPSLEVFRVTAVERLRRLVGSAQRAIEDVWTGVAPAEAIGPRVAELLRVLAAEGCDVPSVRAEDLVADFGHDVWATSRALDQALSTPNTLPTLSDVAAASNVSTRSVQRTLPAVFSAWGQSVPDFRTHRHRVLMARACLIMSQPGATTEHTARTLGFSNPNAFCRAFAASGLPSPSRVREQLVAITN